MLLRNFFPWDEKSLVFFEAEQLWGKVSIGFNKHAFIAYSRQSNDGKQEQSEDFFVVVVLFLPEE